MKKILKNIIGTATFRQSSVTSVGTILNGALGALFYIIVARMLGPAEFGLLTVSITTLTLIADVADIGTNTGLIRFVSYHLNRKENEAFRFLKLSLEIKVIVWVTVLILAYFLAPVTATGLFHKPDLILPLRLVSLGVGGALLFSFATSSLQAFQKYFSWSLVNILTNALRLFLILVLGYLLQLNTINSLLVYITLPFFGFFVTFFILPGGKILSAKNETGLFRKLFAYNLPVAGFTFIAAISSRMDTFISASLLSAREVGIYGAANQLVQVVPQLISALGVVAAPKFAGFDTVQKMMEYLKKFQLFVTAIILIGILLIPVAVYLIPVILGSQYQPAVIPFVILFLAMMIFLFSLPIHNSVIYYYARPDVFIWVSLGHLLIISGLGYLMISHYGVTGAAITVLVGTVFNFFAPFGWFLNRIRRHE